MKFSGIGGQAVMEGVMMKNGVDYAVAVRTSDGNIEVTKDKQKHNRDTINKIPLIRGVVAFVDSLVLGISTLMISASYFEEEDTKSKDVENNPQREVSNEDIESKKRAKEIAEMAVTITISTVIAIVLFMLLPYGLSKLLTNWLDSPNLLALIEGILRVIIFLLYIVIISRMEDIKRVFMYHGAEHKCINCIEHGLELNVENVRISSRFHKRCGTSFLMIVLIISIFVFMFIRFDNNLIQILARILLVPVIAGLSYEFLRIAGRYDNKFIEALSAPGLLVQRLTTIEPEDEMIEVGIQSVESVFDWKEFVQSIELE
ncbi:MAG TPA: DUF1385 domain-containing protein [Lachnospiraceae bacterium]|nr:DUF1385 domain-containing protein [Lachnospiraceae bacterium]